MTSKHIKHIHLLKEPLTLLLQCTYMQKYKAINILWDKHVWFFPCELLVETDNFLYKTDVHDGALFSIWLGVILWSEIRYKELVYSAQKKET